MNPVLSPNTQIRHVTLQWPTAVFCFAWLPMPTQSYIGYGICVLHFRAGMELLKIWVRKVWRGRTWNAGYFPPWGTAFKCDLKSLLSEPGILSWRTRALKRQHRLWQHRPCLLVEETRERYQNEACFPIIPRDSFFCIPWLIPYLLCTLWGKVCIVAAYGILGLQINRGIKSDLANVLPVLWTEIWAPPFVKHTRAFHDFRLPPAPLWKAYLKDGFLY